MFCVSAARVTSEQPQALPEPPSHEPRSFAIACSLALVIEGRQAILNSRLDSARSRRQMLIRVRYGISLCLVGRSAKRAPAPHTLPHSRNQHRTRRGAMPQDTAGPTRSSWHLWFVGALGLLWNSLGAFDFIMMQSQNAS